MLSNSLLFRPERPPEADLAPKTPQEAFEIRNVTPGALFGTPGRRCFNPLRALFPRSWGNTWPGVMREAIK